jgi:hypothetical protein
MPRPSTKTEKINEVILGILGIEDSDEIDYSTYKTLLRAKLVEATGLKSKIHAQEFEQLKDEWKRIRSKSGRFKVKQSKVKTESFFGKGVKTEKTYKPSKEKYLPSSQKVSTPSNIQKSFFANEGVSESLKEVSQTLNRIHKSLLLQAAEEKKEEERDRRSAENKARSLKESRLEKAFKGLVKIAETIIKPFKSVLDRVFDFIFNVLLGTTVLKLIDWMNDPANQDKITSIQRFLTDHWPKLLGAYLLFGNSLGRFIATITGTLIKQLARLAVANPVVAAGLAAGGLLAATAISDRNRRDDEAEQSQKRYAELITGKTEDGKLAPGAYGPSVEQTPEIVPTKKNWFQRMFDSSGSSSNFAGGSIPQVQQKSSGGIIDYREISYEDGGDITSQSGIKIKGAGRDTQLVAARPGEVVLTPEDRNFIKGLTGFDVLKYVKNRKPKMANNIQFANMGGIVGGDTSFGSAALNIGTSFGGAPGIKQNKWIEAMMSGSNDKSRFGESTKITKGSVKSEPQSSENIVNASLFNLQAATPTTNSDGRPYYGPFIQPIVNKKAEKEEGIFTEVKFFLSGLFSPGQGTEDPKTPEKSKLPIFSRQKNSDRTPKVNKIVLRKTGKERPNLENNRTTNSPSSSKNFVSSSSQSAGTTPRISGSFVPIPPGNVKNVPEPMSMPQITTDILPPISSPNTGTTVKNPSTNVSVPEFSVISPSSRAFNSKMYFD